MKALSLLAVLRGLFPIKHPIVPEDMSNPDAIVLEDVGSSLSFCLTMQLILPQGTKGLFVAPEGEREDFARLDRLSKRSTERNPSIASIEGRIRVESS
ncbi:MAG TPA: hypothetical protein VKU38_14950, partial [Ktedonobacteraceae bacterium]|nr:hypothetical protein [Ktedonobacteraceae bacterium]